MIGVLIFAVFAFMAIGFAARMTVEMILAELRGKPAGSFQDVAVCAAIAFVCIVLTHLFSEIYL